MRRWLGTRHGWAAFTNRLRHSPARPHSTASKTASSSGGGGGKHSDGAVSKHEETYRQLHDLDFMTAAKILFTDPPKKKKFGLDFHLVQLFFACMPSLAVYLVAQYARYEIRRMEAELEIKKKAEEEAKARDDELKASEEKEGHSIPDLVEVKVRLDKLEEAVKEIAVESKKQLDKTSTKSPKDISEKDKDGTNNGNTEAKSEARSSKAIDQTSKPRAEGKTPSSRQEDDSS